MARAIPAEDVITEQRKTRGPGVTPPRSPSPLKLIEDLTVLLARTQDYQEALEGTVRMVADALDCEVCSLYSYDPETEKLSLAATVGLPTRSIGRVSMHRSEGLAGLVIEFPVVVSNDGSAPLEAVALAGTPPRGWEVAFDPQSIDLIAPGEVAQATARITPAANAVAGDYDVTLRASTEQSDDSIAVRTTVETSTLWGLVGLAIIAIVLVGLFLVFRRYGRR